MAYFSMLKKTLKNFITRPATLMYPKKKRIPFEKTRGQISIEIEKCIFCGLCQRRCPSYAITVDKSSKKWEIDRLKCVICNNCCEVCPTKCLSMKKDYYSPIDKKNKSTSVETKIAPATAQS